ncbi:hypothetical protein PZA11_004817 [Diplocarpon coronariae]
MEQQHSDSLPGDHTWFTSSRKPSQGRKLRSTKASSSHDNSRKQRGRESQYCKIKASQSNHHYSRAEFKSGTVSQLRDTISTPWLRATCDTGVKRAGLLASPRMRQEKAAPWLGIRRQTYCAALQRRLSQMYKHQSCLFSLTRSRRRFKPVSVVRLSLSENHLCLHFQRDFEKMLKFCLSRDEALLRLDPPSHPFSGR